MLMHKNIFLRIIEIFFMHSALTLQVVDFNHFIYCLRNEHFVETRIDEGLRGVKGALSTKLCTLAVDI
jgi:hypothetical protein